MANKKKDKSDAAAAELARQQREEARQRERAVSAGTTVQFRVDGEIMDLLTQVANHKRTPVGVIARMWVVERLYEEAEKMRSQTKR